MGSRDLLVTWLNDAYSMEKALIHVLEEHADDAESFPDIRQRDLQHVEETRRHAELVEKCLESLGEKPSKSKNMMGEIFGRIQAMGTAPFQDELTKNFLLAFATEQFEIAAYRSLAIAARQLGEEDIARTCDEIRSDEEQMASWVEQNLERAVGATLEQSASS